jgi:DnaJ-class molecular chaperone
MRKKCWRCGGGPIAMSAIEGVVPCPTCRGVKRVKEIIAGRVYEPWPFSDGITCPTCYGRGGVTCPTCQGTGYIDED